MYQLTFGIHKGKTLDEVPEAYLAWLAINSHAALIRSAAAAKLRKNLRINKKLDLNPADFPTWESASALSLLRTQLLEQKH
jgi:hypothetical protein